MAKVAGPLHSECAAGKFGGVLVFDSWRGMQVVRCLSSPAYKSTTARSTRRSYLQRLNTLWKSLSLADRISWNRWAEHRHQSGHNAFIACNSILLLINRPTILAQPKYSPPTPLATLTATWAAGYTPTPPPVKPYVPPRIDINWTPWNLTYLYAVIFRCIRRTKHTTPDLSEYSFYASTKLTLKHVFLNYPAYGTHHFRIKLVDYRTGLCSTWLHTQVDCPTNY